VVIAWHRSLCGTGSNCPTLCSPIPPASAVASSARSALAESALAGLTRVARLTEVSAAQSRAELHRACVSGAREHRLGTSRAACWYTAWMVGSKEYDGALADHGRSGGRPMNDPEVPMPSSSSSCRSRVASSRGRMVPSLAERTFAHRLSSAVVGSGWFSRTSSSHWDRSISRWFVRRGCAVTVSR
jgi:hypothetical protein